jgi:hypothetical protein
VLQIRLLGSVMNGCQMQQRLATSMLGARYYLIAAGVLTLRVIRHRVLPWFVDL